MINLQYRGSYSNPRHKIKYVTYEKFSHTQRKQN